LFYLVRLFVCPAFLSASLPLVPLTFFLSVMTIEPTIEPLELRVCAWSFRQNPFELVVNGEGFSLFSLPYLFPFPFRVFDPFLARQRAWGPQAGVALFRPPGLW
jgi:hypothetical protein